MSLNREGWVDMWRSIRLIEIYVKKTRGEDRPEIMDEIEKVKDQIESVIGQMR